MIYTVVSSNTDELKKEGHSFRDKILEVVVRTTDLEKGVKTPRFYPYRYGMVYDEFDEFKPIDAPGNQRIKDYHISSYYDQLPTARANYARLLEKFQASEPGENEGNKDELTGELKVKEATLKLKEARIEEQTKLIEELKRQLQETKKDEPIQHEEFDTIVWLVGTKKRNVYMYGDAGTGKSHLAEQVAKALNLDFYPASTITQEYKITGYQDMQGIYRDTNFYKAVKHGGLYFLDELDSCSQEVIVGINGVLANKYFDFPHETVKAHENFRVIAAGNTIGRGATEKFGTRQPLDGSTLDRFECIEIKYDIRIEKAITNNDEELIEFAHEFRRVSDELDLNLTFSYRGLSAFKELADGLTIDRIIKFSLIKGVARDDMEMLSRNLNLAGTNKYYKAFKKAI